jgi:hypothetical protein
MLPDDLISSYTSTNYEIRQLTTAEFPIDDFMAVGFSLHIQNLTPTYIDIHYLIDS